MKRNCDFFYVLSIEVGIQRYDDFSDFVVYIMFFWQNDENSWENSWEKIVPP